VTNYNVKLLLTYLFSRRITSRLELKLETGETLKQTRTQGLIARRVRWSRCKLMCHIFLWNIISSTLTYSRAAPVTLHRSHPLQHLTLIYIYIYIYIYIHLYSPRKMVDANKKKNIYN